MKKSSWDTPYIHYILLETLRRNLSSISIILTIYIFVYTGMYLKHYNSFGHTLISVYVPKSVC